VASAGRAATARAGSRERTTRGCSIVRRVV